MNKEFPPPRNIYDLARMADVSPTTVSLVLNGKGNINQATRARILELADRYDFVPSRIARGLRAKRTYSLGVVIDHFHNRFFNSVFEGIEQIADERGYAFFVSESKESYEKEKKEVKLLMEHGVDGVILFPCCQESAFLRSAQQQHNTPVVLIGNYYFGQSFPAVVADNWTGAVHATRKLLSLERRPVLHIAGPEEQSMCSLRRRAFEETIREAMSGGEATSAGQPVSGTEAVSGNDADGFVVRVTDLGIQEGYRAMAEIGSRFTPPYSVFVVNDDTALGAIKYCRQQGLRIPDDVAMVGFSDIDLLEDLDVGLSSVRIPGGRMGSEAARLLIECADEGVTACRDVHIELPVSLIERHTTRVPASA